MKPHHAAALALVGWYLMVPPLDSKGNVLLSAPFNAWEIEMHFDQAGDCEAARQVFIEQSSKELTGLNDEFKSAKTPAERRVAIGTRAYLLEYQASKAKCIATVDLPLKGN